MRTCWSGKSVEEISVHTLQNGQGKSTLAKLIMGELEPITGKVKRHPLMKIGYYSQVSLARDAASEIAAFR